MSTGSCVLIVDDDLAARVRLRDLLERDGQCVVHEVEDGFAALEFVQNILPDLILLDVMMPRMTGLEVCTSLRRQLRTREVPIIVLSAADESEAMLAALEVGADDFLQKPYSAPELRAKVRNITRLNRFRTLTRERDRFRWLLDRSCEPLIIADERGAVAYANTRARELFGLSDGVSEDIATAIARNFRCEPAGALAAWRELRWPIGDKFVIYHPETSQSPARWFDVELQGLEERGETLLKFTNRTGWVQRELETFAFQHLIAHKIRTPLNGLAPVLGYLQAMQEASPDPELHGLLVLARDSAERLQDTLCSVLQYHAAVFAAPSAAVELQTSPLFDIVARAADSSGLTGRVILAGAPVELARPELLELVMTELFENYAKFSQATEKGLRVSCEPLSDRGYEIRLSAPGPDVPSETVAQLGQPYWQPERNFTGEVPGIGLGLATVRQLLRARGAELRLEKNTIVGGIDSRIQLPAAFFV